MLAHDATRPCKAFHFSLKKPQEDFKNILAKENIE
jgi:hypothetical protein